jgi:hypothetical protein
MQEHLKELKLELEIAGTFERIAIGVAKFRSV